MTWSFSYEYYFFFFAKSGLLQDKVDLEHFIQNLPAKSANGTAGSPNQAQHRTLAKDPKDSKFTATSLKTMGTNYTFETATSP